MLQVKIGSYSVPYDTIRVMDTMYNDVITSRFDELRTQPTTASLRQSVSTAALLTMLLAGIVPIVARTTGLPTLLLVLLVGVLYALILVHTNTVVAGLGSALFVLITFNTNVPLVEGPGFASVSVYLLDVALLALAALVIVWWRQSRRSIPYLGKVAISSAALFVVWSFLSAVVGNGPSQIAAFMFSINHVRYLIVLCTAALFISWTDIRYGLYPLLIGVCGHIAVAVAQSVNGGPFGLSHLGEAGAETYGWFVLGPFHFTPGLYASGFTGTARVFVGILLLVVPASLVLIRPSKRCLLGGVAGVSIVAFVIRMTATKAGWAAFVLGVVLFAGGVVAFSDRTAEAFHGVFTGLVGVIVIVGLHAWGSIVGVVDPSTSVRPPSGSIQQGGNRRWATKVNTLDIRLDQYRAAIDIGVEHPLFGIGGSNFHLIARSSGLPRRMAIHNMPLAYLAATGLPGMLFFLCSVVAVAVVAVIHTVESSEDRLLGIALFSGLLAFQAYAFWTTIYTSTTALATFWAFCGIIIGAGTRSEEKQAVDKLSRIVGAEELKNAHI